MLEHDDEDIACYHFGEQRMLKGRNYFLSKRSIFSHVLSFTIILTRNLCKDKYVFSSYSQMMMLRVKSKKILKIAVIKYRSSALISDLCNSKAHSLFIFLFWFVCMYLFIYLIFILFYFFGSW